MAATLEEMSEKLKALTSASQFAESVGTRFRASWGTEESADLELISADALAKIGRTGAQRDPFSLIFRTDSPQFHLPQGTYELAHERHGTLHIFLVPIGPDEKGMRLEAVFN
ncbi:MAG: hypothetical protein ABI318_10980 [Chthoniobacteraceae bacterium]